MTAVFYDLPRVSDQERRRATERLGAVDEFVLAGTPWPEGAPPPRALQTEKNPDFLDRLMAWIERFRAHLEQEGLTPNTFSRRGQSVFEAARYQLMLNVARLVRRWEIAAELGAGRRLIWKDTQVPVPFSLRDAAIESCAPQIEFSRSLEFDPRSWLDRARLRAYGMTEPQRQRARWLTEPPAEITRGRIVFAEYFPNGLRSLSGVARALREQHGLEVVWLAARPEVRKSLAKAQIEAVSLEAFVSPRAIFDSVLTLGERKAIRRAVMRLRDLPVEAGDAAPLRAQIAQAFIAACADATRWLSAFQSAFDQLQPSALVSSTYSSVVGRSAALAARSAGAPSIYVQHGAFPDRYVYAFFCQDALCMWGAYEREGMIRHGVKPELLHVTGAAIYDDLIKRPKSEPSAAGALRIGFLPSNTGGAFSTVEVSRRTFEEIGALARKTGAKITLKPHPADHTPLADELVAKYPEIRVVRDISSQDVIIDSDVVVVVTSTTGFEACVAGRPLIVFNLTGATSPLEYVRYGAAIEVTQPEDLAAAIDRAARDPACRASLAEGRQRLLDRMLDGARGDAASKVARVVAEIRGPK